MPVAPLAKGLIFSLSLLVAAGIAVYDNPQFWERLEEFRRKYAIPLPGLNEDHRRPNPSRSARSQDASVREDASPEAAERRRQAREEILRRGRVMEERRRERARQADERRTSSFDQLVNNDGSLRHTEKHMESDATATTTATEVMREEGMRERTQEAAGVAMGVAAANPFADEMGMDIEDEKEMMEQAPSPQEQRERSVTLQPTSPLTINTDITQTQPPSQEAGSDSGSEALIDLTPTASVAPSRSATLLSSSDILTPTSTHHPDATQDHGPSTTPVSFQAIQEWASTASTGPASFYSPPESERHYESMETASEGGSQATSTAVSVIGTDEAAEEAMEGVDTMSDIDQLSTPSSWSEVSSEVGSSLSGH